MENENKELSTNVEKVTESTGSNWGLYGILIFSFAVLLAMLVTAWLDHN